jgi:hypothetical protein
MTQYNMLASIKKATGARLLNDLGPLLYRHRGQSERV